MCKTPTRSRAHSEVATSSAPRAASGAARRTDGAAARGGAWRRVKQVLLRGSRSIGLQARTLDSRWRQERLLVLCYHGISMLDEHEWNPELYMPPSMFRRRLEILRDGGYTVLPLDEAVERLYAGTLPPRSVSLTFDDGAANFYSEALPLLSEFGFPATVYLTTYHTQHPDPVFDVTLPYLLWRGRDATLPGEVVGEAGEWHLRDEKERGDARLAIHTHLTECGRDSATEQAMLADVAARLGVDFDELRAERIMHLMSPEEVADAAQRGISIQLHTHHHRTPRDKSEFAREIEINRQQIEQLTGRRSERWHFCYPNGWHAPQFIPWLRELDVRSATTCQPGIASRASEPILLPRLVDTALLSETEFEGWLSGIAAFLPRRIQPHIHDY